MHVITPGHEDDFTKSALEHIKAAQQALADRTADRESRGIEGTHNA